MNNKLWKTQHGLNIKMLGLPPILLPLDSQNLAGAGEDQLTFDRLRAGLEAGGLHALTPNTTWAIWRTAAGFDGQLMQRESIAEFFTGAPLLEAVAKALSWTYECQG